MTNLPSPLKILWITERFPPLAGGMAVSSHRQANALRRAGIHVDVLILNASAEVEAISIQRAERDGGTDIFVTHREEPGNASQRAWREVFERTCAHPYHMVIGFGAGFPGYVAVTYACWLAVPSMVSVRGNDFDRDWFEPRRSVFVREALSRADSVAAVSIEKTEKIKQLYPGKRVFWSPNGIDQSLWKLLPSELEERDSIRLELNGDGKRIIGLFGELKYKKQIPMLISAIHEQGITDKLSLLVTGRMDAETDAILSDPTFAPYSRHISFRSPDTLPPLYAACDFMAIPSLFEGFPNVLLEGMAAGVVPIVSDAGAMKEVIDHGETGFIFQAGSRKKAGSAVSEAVNLPEKELVQMKKRAREYVRSRFSIENEASVLIREIKTILSRCTLN